MTKTIEELGNSIRRFYHDNKTQYSGFIFADSFGTDIDFSNKYQVECLLNMVIVSGDYNILSDTIDFATSTTNIETRNNFTKALQIGHLTHIINIRNIELTKKFVSLISDEEKTTKLYPLLKNLWSISTDYNNYNMQNWVISLAPNQETIDEMIKMGDYDVFTSTANDGNLKHIDKIIKLTPNHDMKLEMLTIDEAFKNASLIIRARIAAELAEMGCTEELTKLIKRANPDTNYKINNENPEFLIKLGSSHQALYKSNPKWDHNNILQIGKFAKLINPFVLACKDLYLSTSLVNETLKNILGNIRFYRNKENDKGKDIELDSTQRLKIFDAAKYEAERFKLPQSPENSKANNEISFLNRIIGRKNTEGQSR